ncbi:hypothetical protein SESBI_35763 [Sesbania bispinosa]|nr:hypothetical protein SESBI_35763 [Sesbania bispinosa]
MANSAEGNQRLQEMQEAKRRRDTEVEDTSSSNQIPSTDGQTKSHADNGQCSSKPEKVVFNGDMEMKERLKQLHTAILTQKIKPPTNYAAEMVSLLNRRSIRSIVSPPCFNPSSSHTQNPQVPSPPIKIPAWMPLLFKPPSDMSLSDTEAELEVYIFMNSHVLDGKEILVLLLVGLAIGDWQTVRTIMPTKNVSTQFMQMVELALNNNKSLAELSRDYKECFMGYVGLIRKIFIPVNDNDMHCNDCGVQVARWMMECISDDNYQSIGVNAESRMRLALDLVLNRHNQMRNETVRKAHQKFKVFTQDWDNCYDI